MEVSRWKCLVQEVGSSTTPGEEHSGRRGGGAATWFEKYFIAESILCFSDLTLLHFYHNLIKVMVTKGQDLGDERENLKSEVKSSVKNNGQCKM